MALTAADVPTIVTLLAGTGRLSEGAANALMSGVPDEIRRSRRGRPSPRLQVRHDLELILGDADPARRVEGLAAWLTAAIALAPEGSDGRRVLSHMLLDMESGAIEAPDVAIDEGDPELKQRVILDNDLLPASFMHSGMVAARSVCRLTLTAFRDGKARGFSYGTGWLVAPGLVLTCDHVVHEGRGRADVGGAELAHQVASLRAEFAYFGDHDAGANLPIKGLVAADEGLDFALLSMDAPADVTPLMLRRGVPEPAPGNTHASVNIVQHPHGGPKMVALRNNAVSGHDDAEIRYFADTRRGSSGAPVMDDDFRVVALHRATTVKPGLRHQGRGVSRVNAGRRIGAILDALVGLGVPATWSE